MRAMYYSAYYGFIRLVASMSLFEYIAILVALILGLAVSNTLTKVSLMVQFDEAFRDSWHVLAWSLLVLFTAVGYFFGFWRMYSDRSDISILEFTLAPFLSVILFFLVSRFLPVSSTENLRMAREEYFLTYKNVFFFCFIFLWLQLLISINILKNNLGIEATLLERSQYILPILLIFGIFLKTTKQQQILVSLYAAVYVVQEFVSTSIG